MMMYWFWDIWKGLGDTGGMVGVPNKDGDIAKIKNFAQQYL